MNLFSDIRDAVIAALQEMHCEGTLSDLSAVADVAVESPRDPRHGDMATNAAMVLGNAGRLQRRDMAGILAAKLESDPRIAAAEVAGPGFVNMRLVPSAFQGVVSAVLVSGTDYGRVGIGRQRRASVEFVSANPTGPLHVGHCRGAVFGDALAELLTYVGYDVTREYWVNDAGAQVDVLARSAYERYREANGQQPVIDEDHYPGDYLVPVGEALRDRFGDSLLDRPESDWLEEFRSIAIKMMMEEIHTDLAALGVVIDVFSSERSYHDSGRIEHALDELEGRGLVYRGVLEPPRGKVPPEDWEPREQLLFRSSAYGDDLDRPFRKSDGSWTYFAPDIAYHWDKLKRGFDVIINVFGSDHGGYVKRMTAVVEALRDRPVEFDIKLCQMVRLFRSGAPVKMSKRAGTFVTMRNVIDEVGADVTRFAMLTRRNDAPLDFDFDRVLEQSRDNPVFYVQYAAARICSVIRKAGQAGIAVDDSTLRKVGLGGLDHEAQLAVARKLAEWPRLVEMAARDHEPHRIASYLYELAGYFHALWNRGNDLENLRFVQDADMDASQAKIALARAVFIVISAGLGILGIRPAQEMR